MVWAIDRSGFTSTLTLNGLVRHAPLGLLGGAAFLALLHAIVGTFNAYAAAVEHGGLLLTTVIGAALFKEPLRRRLPGIVLISGGALCLAIADPM
jgi:uncharacterized membrane protein